MVFVRDELELQERKVESPEARWTVRILSFLSLCDL